MGDSMTENKPTLSMNMREETGHGCGMPLSGAAQLIGVCAECIAASTLAENTPRNRQPRYGFTKRRTEKS